MECGQHCVNGVASMIFSAVVYIAALVVVLLVYFKGNSNWDYVYMVGLLRQRSCCAGSLMHFSVRW